MIDKLKIASLKAQLNLELTVIDEYKKQQEELKEQLEEAKEEADNYREEYLTLVGSLGEFPDIITSVRYQLDRIKYYEEKPTRLEQVEFLEELLKELEKIDY